MKVSVEVPDPPPLDQILEGLSRQYAEVVHQLMRLTASAQAGNQQLFRELAGQQDGLMQAFDRMMSRMLDSQQGQQQTFRDTVQQHLEPAAQSQQELLTAIRGVRRSLTDLPDDLGSVMNRQLKSRQEALQKSALPKTRPPSTNPSAQIVDKLDSMEEALLKGLKKSRSRTFGSNY